MPQRYELTVEGHKIVAFGYNEGKPGLPAIFIPGITASASFWTILQTPIFHEHFRWYSLSLPGHYPAVFPDHFRQEDLSADMLARVHCGAIRQLVGAQPVLLAGHSTGGFSALNIAAHAPELAAAVISISGFAHGRWIGGLGLMQTLARWNRTLFRAVYGISQTSPLLNRPMWRIYAANWAGLYRNLNPVYRHFFADFRHLDLRSAAMYFSRMPDINIGELLPRITVPTLVLTGDRDPIVPPAQSHLIARSVGAGRLVEMRGIGHLPMFERPAEYHRIITEWVRQLEPLAAAHAA